VDLPADLREALDAALGRTPVAELAPAVESLIARYRAPGADPVDEAILARPVEVLAYAAYRMPATYAAVRAALTQVAGAVPDLQPRSLLDLGGGTGAATWAATDVFPGLAELTILDRVPAALRLGERLAGARPALRAARWEEWTQRAEETPLRSADLVTISYVLGELPEPARDALLGAAVRAATKAVVVVEPGTPAGYGRVLAAREALISAGQRVVAPCPHERPCPLPAASDWCHFAVRVNRSATHRRAKGATLGYEDEKFSYVAAVRDPADLSEAGPARVLRHPAYGKGLVRLRLCAPTGTATDEIISKRQGERYRAARDLAWGDAWPPHGQDPTRRSVFRGS
jgi:ribosomal protein RSM22 (predicted rRNA methylase)